MPPITCEPELTPVTPPAEQPTWTLVWADEFDEPEINRANWVFESGAHGWGNNELQYYTDRPQNARIEDSKLIIEAHKEDYLGAPYTSARLKTQGLHAWTYGKIEARAKIPFGQGIWPAFWMLGVDIEAVGWPRSGEIDIMEYIGREPCKVFGTIHGPGYAGAEGPSASVTLGTPVADEFRIFSIEWYPNDIYWYVESERDGQRLLYGHQSRSTLPLSPAAEGSATRELCPWVFDHDFFILVNLAVGGNWPGYPDETTTFPQRYELDYVRVYQQQP